MTIDVYGMDFTEIYGVSLNVLNDVAEGADISQHIASGKAVQGTISGSKIKGIGFDHYSDWQWVSTNSSDGASEKKYLYGISSNVEQYGVLWVEDESVKVFISASISDLGVSSGGSSFMNTLGDKYMEDYEGTIIETDFANIYNGTAYLREGLKFPVKKDGIQFQATADANKFSKAIKANYLSGDVEYSYDSAKMSFVTNHFKDATYATAWQTMDKSEDADSRLYLMVTFSYQVSSSATDYILYGVMWEKEGIVQTFMTTNASDLTSVKSAENSANRGTVPNTGITDYEDYDTSNDQDIGGNQEELDVDLRDISEDDETLNRLAQIRQELKNKKKQEKSNAFDILLKISGVIVLFYTILLAIAYVLDLTNTVVDVELTRILTFDRAVCVRDTDDLQMYESENSSQFLMTKKRFIIYTIVGILAGVFLMNAGVLREVAEVVYKVMNG